MFHEDAAHDYDNRRETVANPELHMIATIKTQLRQMRREGKAVGLINAIAYSNYQMKNLKDWMNAGTMKKLLDQRAFSTETDKLVQFTMTESGGAIRPLQNPWEISELMKRVREKQPRVIVEIGTAKGGTLFLLCQHAADDAVGGYPPVMRGRADQHFAQGTRFGCDIPHEATLIPAWWAAYTRPLHSSPAPR